MARKIKVLVSWTSLSTLEFLLFVANLMLCLTGNIKFPNLPVTLIKLKAAYDRLTAAYPLRKKGDIERQEYEDAETDLDNMVHEIADYVTVVAKGNAADIYSAGFSPSKGAYSAATIPASPAAVALTQSKGSPLHLSIGKVVSADSYVVVLFLGVDYFLISVKDNSIIFSPSSIRTIIIPNATTLEVVNGLEAGTHVFVQALAQNSAGKSAFSPLTDIIIN